MNKTLANFNRQVMTREDAWTAVGILTVVAGATIGRTLLKLAVAR